MCIELYIDKVLVYSKCETIDLANVSNVSNVTITNASNATNMSNVSNIPQQFINHTRNITYNSSEYVYNMTLNSTVIQQFVPSARPANTTTNVTGHLTFSPSPSLVNSEDTLDVVMKILIPLFVLGGVVAFIFLCRRKKKVKAVKMVENPLFEADVEPGTPIEHKDPDVVHKEVEHKDPDVKKQTDEQSNK